MPSVPIFTGLRDPRADVWPGFVASSVPLEPQRPDGYVQGLSTLKKNSLPPNGLAWEPIAASTLACRLVG